MWCKIVHIVVLDLKNEQKGKEQRTTELCAAATMFHSAAYVVSYPIACTPMNPNGKAKDKDHGALNVKTLSNLSESKIIEVISSLPPLSKVKPSGTP